MSERGLCASDVGVFSMNVANKQGEMLWQSGYTTNVFLERTETILALLRRKRKICFMIPLRFEYVCFFLISGILNCSLFLKTFKS